MISLCVWGWKIKVAALLPTLTSAGKISFFYEMGTRRNFHFLVVIIFCNFVNKLTRPKNKNKQTIPPKHHIIIMETDQSYLVEISLYRLLSLATISIVFGGLVVYISMKQMYFLSLKKHGNPRRLSAAGSVANSEKKASFAKKSEKKDCKMVN